MEIDNAIQKDRCIWVEAVSNFLPEDQRNKGYDYFRPNIDYSALAEVKTGIATLDLAAKTEEFCRTARISSFNYDGGDIATRGCPIIEIAYMCEKRERDKSVIAKRLAKPHKVALCAVIHKIVNIIFAVLREQKPFELRSPEEHDRMLKERHQIIAA